MIDLRGFSRLPSSLNAELSSVRSDANLLTPSPCSPRPVESPTYRPSDGQFSAGSSAPADVRRCHHRNCKEKAAAKNLSHTLRSRTNRRLNNLSLAEALKHPSSANIVSMSRPVPNATPKCHCWNAAAAEDREAKRLREFRIMVVSSTEVTAGL